jgi:hypothetical protein
MSLKAELGKLVKMDDRDLKNLMKVVKSMDITSNLGFNASVMKMVNGVPVPCSEEEQEEIMSDLGQATHWASQTLAAAVKEEQQRRKGKGPGFFSRLFGRVPEKEEPQQKQAKFKADLSQLEKLFNK